MTAATPSFLELEEQFPRRKATLPNGETLSYVDIHHQDPAPKYTLLVIPGYACDSKYTALTLARYEAFRDHRIIGVDPRGYGESTQHTENWSHEENAEDIKLFLDAIFPMDKSNSNDSTGISNGDAANSAQEDTSNKIMVLGYSTGAGAAAWLALNYPERISALFMVSALPLNGMRTSLLSTKTGKPTGDWLTSKAEAIRYADTIMTPSIHSPNLQTFRYTIGATCLDQANLPATNDDRGFQLYHEAAMNHRSRAQALYANNAFNLTPIPTPIAMSSSPSLPPQNVLRRLQCPMMIIHGAKDALIKTRHVRAVTDLAILERWAPPGLLAYYEIPDCGHLFMYDNPVGFQRVYRRSLEAQVISRDGGSSKFPRSSL